MVFDLTGINLIEFLEMLGGERIQKKSLWFKVAVKAVDKTNLKRSI